MNSEINIKPYSRIKTKNRLRESQENKLLKLFKLKKIVTLTEILNLRIASHTKVISKLRERGHNIRNVCRYQDGIKYSVYTLQNDSNS